MWAFPFAKSAGGRDEVCRDAYEAVSGRSSAQLRPAQAACAAYLPDVILKLHQRPATDYEGRLHGLAIARHWYALKYPTRTQRVS
jgi:hypothetical protein